LDGLLRVHKDFTDEEKVCDYGKGVKRIQGNVAGYIYFLYLNESNNVTLEENFKMTARKYLEIYPP
jgi:hypothetical protein